MGLRVAVVGGGVAGLAGAYRLLELKKEKKADLEMLLFERSGRVGGVIGTEKRDGFILEKGPDAFISEKPGCLELCRRLGIESEIIGTKDENRKSFVARGERLIPVPEGFYLIAPTRIGSFLASPLLSLPGKLRVMLEPFVPKRVEESDESIGSFIRRRFGSEALEKVGQAMLAGIYTGDPNFLSLSATMPRFSQLEKKYGSVIRGLRAAAREKNGALGAASGPRYSLFLSFKNGMRTLTDEIAKRLPVGSVKLNSEINQIAYDPPAKKWRLVMKSGPVEWADVVCVTSPAKSAAGLLGQAARGLSEKLAAISYESVATINFAHRGADIAHRLDGFGFVVPKMEKRATIACSFSSQKFDGRAPKGFTLLRAFVGGVFGREYLDLEDADLINMVENELKAFLGLNGKPLFTYLSRYPTSMPQYGVGHENLVKEIREELKKWPGLFLTGAAYRGVGIPDCITDAEAQAEAIRSFASLRMTEEKVRMT